MAWLILSGWPGATDYDSQLALVRHNGTAGEGVAFSDWGLAGYALSYAAPYGYVWVRDTRSGGASPSSTKAVDLAAWPPTLFPTTLSAAGTPFTCGAAQLRDGVYYGMGRNGDIQGLSAERADCITRSYDGKAFYLLQSAMGAGDSSLLVAGADGRWACAGPSPGRFQWTENFVDFTAVVVSSSPSAAFTAFAGTSTGYWIGRVSEPTMHSWFRSTDHLQTIAPLTLPVSDFNRVWAFGATLYGAVAGTLYASTDGLSWTSKGTPLGSASIAVYGMAADPNGQFLLVGQYGNARTTTDFVTYTPLPGYAFQGHALWNAVYVPAAALYSSGNPGTATIQGTLRLDSATGPFAARKVILYKYPDGDKVAEVASDAVTGAWSFTQVKPGSYFVVAVAQGDDLNVPRDFDALGVITVT